MLASLDPATFNKSYIDAEADAPPRISLNTSTLKVEGQTSKQPNKPAHVQPEASDMESFSANDIKEEE